MPITAIVVHYSGVKQTVCPCQRDLSRCPKCEYAKDSLCDYPYRVERTKPGGTK